MRTHLLALAAAALTAIASSPADAGPRRLVVLDFDGPRALADAGRSAVMSVLGDDYDVVATRRWESARAKARGRGPAQWRAAARTAGVDAVIEGWIQDADRRPTLTVAVREAATGTEIDTVTVRMRGREVSSEASRKLAAQLDEVLAWIDGDVTAGDAGRRLPDVRELREERRRRARDDVRYAVRYEEDGDGERDDERGDERDDERGDAYDRRARRARGRDRDRDRDRDEDRGDDRDRDDDRTDADVPSPRRAADELAVLDDSRATRELLDLFGPDSHEAAVVAERKPTRVMRRAPRFVIAGGGFVATRGMTFEQNPPDSQTLPPDYPAQAIAGLAVDAAVFPRPLRKLDTQPTGLGFSVSLARSVNSQLAAYDAESDTFGAYTLEHTAYAAAIRYRYPMDLITFDGEASYGKATYRIFDLPGGIQIPDTDYTFVSAGGHVELAITERTRFSAGGRLMYLLSAGDVSDQDWYGAGTGGALSLDAGVSIPLTDLLYVRGGLEYRRFALDFEQSGMVSDELDISRLVDSSISGVAQLGVAF